MSSGGDFENYTARYYHIREEDKLTLRAHLLRSLPFRASPQLVDEGALSLQLESLLDIPLIALSNGQNRRARILQALLSSPSLLVLEEPFSTSLLLAQRAPADDFRQLDWTSNLDIFSRSYSKDSTPIAHPAYSSSFDHKMPSRRSSLISPSSATSKEKSRLERRNRFSARRADRSLSRPSDGYNKSGRSSEPAQSTPLERSS